MGNGAQAAPSENAAPENRGFIEKWLRSTKKDSSPASPIFIFTAAAGMPGQARSLL
jgi:hypothetical protein